MTWGEFKQYIDTKLKDTDDIMYIDCYPAIENIKVEYDEVYEGYWIVDIV